jgi:hypothetical protein
MRSFKVVRSSLLPLEPPRVNTGSIPVPALPEVYLSYDEVLTYIAGTANSAYAFVADSSEIARYATTQ